MDRLLMTLGFTKSKEDSNLCFKVEDRRPVMLLLYVDDLFLTKKRNSLNFQEGDLLPSLRWRTWIYALLSKHGGVVECGWNLPGTREVCSKRSWIGSGWWTARPWPHLWHQTWSYWVLLHHIRLIPRCIVRSFVPWCTWQIQDQIFSLLWTHQDMFT